MDHHVQQRVFDTFPFLQQADKELQEQFFARGIRTHLSAGQFICMESNQCTHLPLVLSGTARVYKLGEQGREITLYRIEPGESCILTTSCILSKRSFPAFAVAETDLEAIVIPAAVFPVWFERFDAWRTYIFELLSHRLSSVIELVEEVAFRQMDARVAAYLLDAPVGGVIERTHQAIATDLGTSREVVSRILKEFEHEGLVTLSRGAVHVSARKALNERRKKSGSV